MEKTNKILKILTITLFFFLYNFAISEELTVERIWFENANFLFETIETEFPKENTDINELKEDLYKNIIYLYNKVIYSENKYDNLITFSIFNKALIFRNMNNIDSSISNFKLILNKNLDDSENIGANGIMDNPYANYNYRATKYISEMYYEKGYFDSVFYYLHLNKKYPYHSSCGNAYASEDNDILELLGKTYINLNLIDSAEKKLIYNITNDGLSNNYQLAQLLIEVLLTKNTKEFLIKEYNKSIENFINNLDFYNLDLDKDYYIEFLNYKIPFNNYKFYRFENFSKFKKERQDSLIETFKKDITNSHFYKILTETKY